MMDSAKKWLAFEDLTKEGFKNVNKIHGLDYDHLKLSLSKLAEWHAATAILLLMDKKLFQCHNQSQLHSINAHNIQKFFMNIAMSIASISKTWSGFERISNKLANLTKQDFDNASQAYLPSEDNLNVLIHGDMWSNNIMYKYDRNGNPIDVLFVDFALGHWTNPSIDLVCLLYSSSHRSVHQKDRERLIQHYHIELIQLLTQLEYPKKLPTLMDIQTLVFRVDLYNAIIVLFIIGIRHVKMVQGSGVLAFTEDTEDNVAGRINFFSDPYCVEELKYLLDLFDRRGYFDCNFRSCA